ncbi:MAG: hypothetical protein MHM6MM_003729 [Cercozoa sp. M6MM]
MDHLSEEERSQLRAEVIAALEASGHGHAARDSTWRLFERARRHELTKEIEAKYNMKLNKPPPKKRGRPRKPKAPPKVTVDEEDETEEEVDPEYEILAKSARQAGQPALAADEQRRATLLEILDELIARPESLAFREPVTDEIAPGYSEIIEIPMDTSTLRRRLLQGGFFPTVQHFIDALSLIWINCRTYNAPESELVEVADELDEWCRGRLQEALPSDRSLPLPSARMKTPRERLRNARAERVRRRAKEVHTPPPDDEDFVPDAVAADDADIDFDEEPETKRRRLDAPKRAKVSTGKKKRGRPKGSKNKSTREREAREAAEAAKRISPQQLQQHQQQCFAALVHGRPFPSPPRPLAEQQHKEQHKEQELIESAAQEARQHEHSAEASQPRVDLLLGMLFARAQRRRRRVTAVVNALR